MAIVGADDRSLQTDSRLKSVGLSGLVGLALFCINQVNRMKAKYLRLALTQALRQSRH